jgi:putative ABC transport system permease protein
VIATAAGARRSVTAYDRLAEVTGQPDATLISFVGSEFVERVAELPEVQEAWILRGVVGQVLNVREISYITVIAGGPRPPDLMTPLVEEGRLPADDAADEVAVDEGFAEAVGIEVGDHVPIGLLTQEEFEAFDEGFGQPDGPTVDLEVVGTFRLGGNTTNESVALLGTPAFAEVAREGGGGPGLMVRLVDGDEAARSFEDGVLELSAEYEVAPDATELGRYDLKLAADDRDRSQASAVVVARGLLILGLSLLLVGGLGVGQAIARMQGRTAGDEATLQALGVERRGRAAALAAPFALIAVPVAAVTSVVGAILLSPLFPIGTARTLEPSPGVDVNVAVIAIGAVGVVVVLLGIVALVAVRADRARLRAVSRPRPLTGRLARSGVPLSIAIGTPLALDRGTGRRAVPVRTAIGGGVAAVAAVIGAVTFAASLDRLVDTPSRYGSPGDAMVSDARPELFDQLQADPDVDAVLETHGFDLVIDGVRRDALTTEVRKGSITYDYVEGRAPAGPAEIALGPGLADELHVGVGDQVAVGPDEVPLTVVGLVLARADTPDRYAETAIIDEALRPEVTEGQGYVEAVIRFTDDADVEAEIRALGQEWEIDATEPPTRVDDLSQVRNLPLVLAAAAAALGLVLLGHALVVAVRRRGHDFALLRAFGARPGDTARTVVAMTATIVVIGVGLGIPLGFIAANVAWRELAQSLDVAGDLVVPAGLVALCLPVAAAAGLAAAALPTWRATHLQVATLLRSE